jgi:hypothetical protein
MKNVRLAWIVKQWLPGITTQSHAGQGVVYVGIGGLLIQSPYKESHAAASQWAADEVGQSLTALGDGLRVEVR